MRYAHITAPAVAGGNAPSPFILGDDALARGPGSRYIIAGWPGFEVQVQKLPYIGAPYMDQLPRGLRDITFSLVCEYEFASESDCFLFVINLPQICPIYGGLQMGVTGAGGGGTVFYPSATISRVTPVMGQSDPQVVSTRIQYDINAGHPAASGAT